MTHTGTRELETPRLLLRRFRYDDIGDMLKNWIANPIVQLNYGEPTYDDEGEVRALLDKWIPQYEAESLYRWAMILKETGENIGQIAFCRVYDEIGTAEIEYCVGEAYWGHGYAAEALVEVLRYSFETPGFHKLEAFHRIENPNSGRVLAKAGMKIVPNVWRFESAGREPMGDICYALTREEYFARRREESLE